MDMETHSLYVKHSGKKLETWPVIIADDVKGLGEFTVFLSSCANTMSTVPGLEQR